MNESTPRCFVTGGAGYIGSNLVDRLLAAGHAVTVYDDFSTGQARFLESARPNPAFNLVEGDILDFATLATAMAGAERVFHLAANADVRFGLEHPSKDVQSNTLGTFNVLEAMRTNEVRQVVFTSTGSIYGEPTVFPTPEDAPFPIQTSLYGASKLAGEGLIQAYSEGYGIQAWIFRFVSILGERYTHGHVFDFCKALLKDPSKLTVLGDGTQRKSYLYVHDCIDAIFVALSNPTSRMNILNLGTQGVLSVRESIGVIARELGVEPQLVYSGGPRGWVGDSPYIQLATDRIQGLGWQPKLSIEEAVGRTVRWILANQWVFDERS